jgi:hypothetical protein
VSRSHEHKPCTRGFQLFIPAGSMLNVSMASV